MYDAIVLGSEIIYAQDPDNIRVFMVLTDGADVSSRHTLLHAHNALGPGVLTELIYIGAPGDDGEANLEAISGDPQSGHVRARTSSPEDLGDLVAGIVDRTCGNWAPVARIALDPSSLQLGRPGFEMELDARGSSDTEDDDELTFHELTYQWTMRRGGERRRAQGPHPIVQFSDADIGDWSVDLTVTDSGNASAPASDSFAVVAPPDIRLAVELEIDVLEELSITASPARDIDNRLDDPDGVLDFTWRLVDAPDGADLAVRENGNIRENDLGVSIARSEDSITLSFETNERDITTRVEEGEEVDFRDPWVFSVTAQDNEEIRSDPPEVVTVRVRNLPPETNLAEYEREIDVGDRLRLDASESEDPDNPRVKSPEGWAWDLVQVPVSAGDRPQDAYVRGPVLSVPTAPGRRRHLDLSASGYRQRR